MQAYDSEVARGIYENIKKGNGDTFPITADVVNGILQNFVYGHHLEYPAGKGQTLHLEVRGDILQREVWTGKNSTGVKKAVQNIINLTRINSKQEKQQIAA